MSILRLADAALRLVPTPKPGVNADAYARALHDWHRSTGFLKIFAAAGNLAIVASQLAEATDPASKAVVARLAANAPKPQTDVVSGEPRSQRNERQKILMRERRAAAKAEHTARANTDSAS
jgi:hypothetical protein